ncbi:hypothetical protein H0H93_002354 [Arthromyces matolae]|nr:hypothetical protein H0H93_002354 [Arthromyces matolae]
MHPGRHIAPYELTKAEKLQVVNLAPTTPVELYVVRHSIHPRNHAIQIKNSIYQIVEELEDRLGDRMEEILTHVESNLAAAAPTTNLNAAESTFTVVDGTNVEGDLYPDAAEEVYHEDIVFDDTGEGAGVEGDLDMEDD